MPTNVKALKELAAVVCGVNEKSVTGETIADVIRFMAKNYAGGGVVQSALGELTITSKMGSTEGLTTLTVAPSVTSGNTYKYKTAPSGLELPDYKADLSDWLTWDGTSDIEGEDGHEICVCEVNSSNLAINGGIATIHSI